MKFGRKRPTRQQLDRMRRRAAVLARHLDPLGPPPPASNLYYQAVESVVGSDWGMMGNGPDPGNPPGIPNGCGDCVWADTGHQDMLRSANSASAIIIPTTAQVIAAYSAHTGFTPDDPNTDNGDNETDVCQYLETTGFLGDKSIGTGAVSISNFDHLRWCIQIFGCSRTGWNVPQSWMDQFNNGQTLSDIGDTNIEGGHDVPLVHYERDTFWIVTWGKRVPMDISMLKNRDYFEEAHVELYPDWVRQQGTAPSGLDLAQLVSDIQAVT